MANDKEKYIPKPNQVNVYKTNTALIEVMDNMYLADTEEQEPFAHIHGKFSRLTLNVSSYGDKKYAYFNVEPSFFKFLLQAYIQCQCDPDYRDSKVFEHKMEKLQGKKPVGKGRHRVCKIFVFRIPTMKKDGKTVKRNSPWGIKIENGSGKIKHGRNNSEYYVDYECDADSEDSKDASISIAFNDYDFFAFLQTCARYVELWENAMAIGFLRKELMEWAVSEDNNYRRTA